MTQRINNPDFEIQQGFHYYGALGQQHGMSPNFTPWTTLLLMI
jgi:hypothetical protein